MPIEQELMKLEQLEKRLNDAGSSFDDKVTTVTEALKLLQAMQQHLLEEPPLRVESLDSTGGLNPFA